MVTLKFSNGLFLTCEHITNLQRPFNTGISVRVTHQVSRKVYQRRSVKASKDKFQLNLLLREILKHALIIAARKTPLRSRRRYT